MHLTACGYLRMVNCVSCSVVQTRVQCRLDQQPAGTQITPQHKVDSTSEKLRTMRAAEHGGTLFLFSTLCSIILLHVAIIDMSAKRAVCRPYCFCCALNERSTCYHENLLRPIILIFPINFHSCFPLIAK